MTKPFISIAAGALAFALTMGAGTAAIAVDPSESPSPTATTTASAPCSVSAKLADPDLATVYVSVVNLDTKTELINVRANQLTPSASVMKLVTAAWAAQYLPMNYTAKTQVLVDVAQPGTLILRGGGDHTLSQVTGTSYTTYGRKAPRLQALVDQTLALWPADQPIEKIVVDASYFEGGGWNRNWWSGYRASGDQAFITALQLDGDRANPDLTDKKFSSKRSTKPVANAAKLFKDRLGSLAQNAKLVYEKAPATATELTAVNSRTMINWMRHALMVSDNTETEMIAFHAAKAAGLPASWASTSKLAKRFMRKNSIDPKRLVFSDASGLADSNRVTAKSVVAVIQAIHSGTAGINRVKSLLPVSGISGSLATRLTGSTRGKVFAKPGYIPGLFSLAGFIDAKDGSHLGFAIFARSVGKTKVTSQTKPAIDALVKRLYVCGSGATR